MSINLANCDYFLTEKDFIYHISYNNHLFPGICGGPECVKHSARHWSYKNKKLSAFSGFMIQWKREIEKNYIKQLTTVWDRKIRKEIEAVRKGICMNFGRCYKEELEDNYLISCG